MEKDFKQMLIDIRKSGNEVMKEALKQALVNIESSEKFSINKLEDGEHYDEGLRLCMQDLNKFCEYWNYTYYLCPIGIGVNVPLIGEWKRDRDKWGTIVLGFLYHDLEDDKEKWIYIGDFQYVRMMRWFYDESILKDKINTINKMLVDEK